VRLLADLGARRRDRVGAGSERPRQGAQLFGIERDRELLHQIDQLTAGDPALRRAGVEQAPEVALAEARIGLDRLERQRRHVAALDQLRAQRRVGHPRRLQQRVDIGRIVLGVDVERVARLIGRGGAIERQLEMDGLLIRARGVEVDVLGHLGLDQVEARCGFGAEIDRDHLGVG
jgi:hypothetical protein